jgi:hypothetical protein
MDKFLKTISSVANSIIDWITHHPKTALTIFVFVVGFILGTLF